ncbi:signal recognition particle-docking protein FtsY [candidate division KSB1 bacterium]
MISLIKSIKNGLKKTRDSFTDSLKSVLPFRRGITEELLEEIEETLILGDLGVETSINIIDVIRDKFQKEKEITYNDVVEVIKREIISQYKEIDTDADKSEISNTPNVILVVGVNGSGKTTSIGKLANFYKKNGKTVLLAAADTFRAAAVEQLDEWKKRTGVDIIKNKEGTDPAAVAFDSAQAALAREVDVLIIDTAGRIHTNVNLMQELEKIKRVIKKVIPDAPHKIILVIDANMGQNSIAQAKIFTEILNVDSIFLTKLDGTAKGGAAIPIMNNLKIPIEFIGIGEQKDDIKVFNIEEFTNSLFE